MAKLYRVVVVVSLLVSLSAFAQSADQQIVSASDAPDPVAPGAALAYTVTVRNNGPDPATNGGVNITLPGAVTHTTDVAPAGWSCFWLGNNGTCNTPSFPVGATEVITINTVVDPSLATFPDQSINAFFSTSGVTSDPGGTNNAASENTQVDSPQVDLSISASDSPDPVFPDGNVTYSVTVTNAGPDTAGSVNFNVSPNSSLRFQSASVPAGWACTLPSVGAVNAAFTCTRPTWAPGTSNFTIGFSANDEEFGVNDTTFNTGFAVNGGASNETIGGNNSTTVFTSYTTPDADVTISVGDSPDPVAADGDITYTVIVGNGGPDVAPNITLNSFGSNNLRFQSATVPAGWSCTLPAAGAQTTSFTCTLPSLASDATSVLTFVMQADDALVGSSDTTILFGFSANSSISDPTPGNNSETESTAYDVPDANLGVTASDSPDPVAAGSSITYTGSVTNAGPDPASNVTLTIPLAPGSLFQSLSGPAGFACATPAVGTNGTITCTIASLPNSSSLPFTLATQVDPSLNAGPDGAIQQQFSIDASTNDPAPANDSVQVTTAYTTPDADLAAMNEDAPDPVPFAGTITYAQTITNNGPDAAVNVTVSQNTPGGTTFQMLVAPPGWACTTPAIDGTGAISCAKASMASGESAVFMLAVNHTSGTPIVSSVVADSDTFDPDGSDNTAQASTTVLAAPSADLSITKTTTSASVLDGSTFSYTLTLTNGGPDAATAVVVTDTLPAGLLFESIASPAELTCIAPSPGTNGTITCSAATLPMGTYALTLVVRAAADSGSVTNTATASSATGDPDSGDLGASAPAVALGPAVADLSISKTTDATTAPTGSTITYTITVANAGPSTATNVVVNDTLPAGLQFVAATPAQGTCNNASPVVCNLGTLNAGASAEITVTAIVTVTSGTIANTATVTGAEGDSDAGDTTSTTAAIPVIGPAVASEAIPTLSEWMLMLLAAMLAVFAALRLRL